MGAITKRRIYLVGEYPACRHGIAQLINSEPDLVVCGETAQPSQAPAGAAQASASLLLLDQTQPGEATVELVKTLRVAQPALPVVVFSATEESQFVLRLLRAGARGYVLKSGGLNELLLAIRKGLAGEIYLNPIFGEQLITVLAQGKQKAASGDWRERLTGREREVLRLIGGGQTVREMAERLKLSTKTVETHRLHIKEKLGLATTAELLRFALRECAQGEG